MTKLMLSTVFLLLYTRLALLTFVDKRIMDKWINCDKMNIMDTMNQIGIVSVSCVGVMLNVLSIVTGCMVWSSNLLIVPIIHAALTILFWCTMLILPILTVIMLFHLSFGADTVVADIPMCGLPAHTWTILFKG